MDGRTLRQLGYAVGLMAAAALAQPAQAYEHFPSMSAPGIGTLGASADIPPPGLYMVDQSFAIAGPTSGNFALQTSLNSFAGTHSYVCFCVHADVLLWNPGWSFLGAKIDFIVAQPFLWLSVGAPASVSQAEFFNTFWNAEASWKWGDSGFYTKIGIGGYTPTGNITGPFGTGGNGSPWWTFQPELVLSYLGGGWNFTAFMTVEINTQNYISQYQTGDVFHADLTAVKTIGKWTFGPVATFVDQFTSDSCNFGCLTNYRVLAGNLNPIGVTQYNQWAVGGLVAYDFGPVTWTVWATQALTPGVTVINQAPPGTNTLISGTTVMSQLSFALWNPEQPAAPVKRPLIYK